MEAVGVVALVLLALAAVGYPLRAALLRVHVPPAVSLMALGVVVGSSGLDLLPHSWEEYGGSLSLAAFAVLLLRAGLGLPPGGLRAILTPVLVLGAIPVMAELLSLAALCHTVLFDRWDVCLAAAFLIGATSPAVVLPSMLNQKDLGRGTQRLVPDRIIGQTVLNAFIAKAGILLFVAVAAGTATASDSLPWLPVQLLGGVALGLVVGWMLRIDLLLDRGYVRTGSLIALAAAFLVYFTGKRVEVEEVFATLALGIVLRRRLDRHEPVMRKVLKQTWGLAEIVLFVNLGSQVDLARLRDVSLVLPLLGVIVAAVVVRVLVAHVMGRFTVLDGAERALVTSSNVPKATIQAVFGAYAAQAWARSDPALAGDGQTLAVMAVLAIVVTAPIGAVLLERFGSRLEQQPVSQRTRVAPP